MEALARLAGKISALFRRVRTRTGTVPDDSLTFNTGPDAIASAIAQTTGGSPRWAVRPSWDEYFIHLTQEVANRATCDRGRSGCVIVQEKRMIATGYVGSPPGLAHCDDAGHQFKKVLEDDGTIRLHCVRTIHAEQNAICQAAKYGVSLKGATLYCKMEPCRVCAMLIISVGIVRVVARRRYHAAQDTRDMFAAAGVELTVFEDGVETYADQATSSKPI